VRELWLKFFDENGEPRRVQVDKKRFVVGRHSECDLTIVNPSLSRDHLEITNLDDEFFVSDLRSSNGTKLNGADLNAESSLRDGDVLLLGGEVQIDVEIKQKEIAAGASEVNAIAGANVSAEIPSTAFVSASTNQGAASSQPETKTSAIPLSFFIIAPLFGLLILAAIGVAAFLFGGEKKSDRGSDDEYVSRRETTPGRSTKEDSDDDDFPAPKPTTKVSPSTTTSGAQDSSTPVPLNSEDDKLEKNALSFARRIAVNDTNYVFTKDQLREIDSRVKSLKNSSAVRENLKAAAQNSAQFVSLAQSKGLKPQFLAAAALAKLGDQRGNPLATAQTILPILGDLKISLGNELTDDCLLIIAAYDQGERGEFRGLRTTIEILTKQVKGVSSSELRTIWFLKKQGKISDSEYQFVLRFLAIGTMMQNPKDFGVESPAIVFN
jgi:predicted component of type VI protein secretion system